MRVEPPFPPVSAFVWDWFRANPLLAAAGMFLHSVCSLVEICVVSYREQGRCRWRWAEPEDFE